MPLTWSAYADVVTPEAGRAVIVRVSHDPTADRAEIWVHAFVNGRMFAHMSAHPCPAIGSADTGNAHSRVQWDLAAGRLSAGVLAGETDRCEFGEGPIPLRVDLRWDTGGRAGSNLRGRDERLTRVSATLSLQGRGIDIEGWGHQHTQTQEQPRFAVPFSYLSLRGDGVGVVGLLAGKLRRGFGTLGETELTITDLQLDPPAERRSLVARHPTGELVGRFERRYRYWIPMGGRWRDGSVVSGELGGQAVSGVINDYAGPAG